MIPLYIHDVRGTEISNLLSCCLLTTVSSDMLPHDKCFNAMFVVNKKKSCSCDRVFVVSFVDCAGGDIYMFLFVVGLNGVFICFLQTYFHKRLIKGVVKPYGKETTWPEDC